MKPESVTGTETVSIFASIYSTEPSYHLDYESVDEFVAALKGVWRETIAGKEDNMLLSPATFDATLSEDTSRGKANVRYIRGLWLDNDGGDLPYGEFAKLFPRLRMVCMNTFSTAPGNERYRVFIPTTHAMTVTVHAEIMGQIERIMNNAGYFSDKQIERSRNRAGSGSTASTSASSSRTRSSMPPVRRAIPHTASSRNSRATAGKPWTPTSMSTPAS